MKREEFKKIVEDAIRQYIDNFYRYDSNPQLRINPDTLAVSLVNGSDMLAELGDNDEALEAAAAAHGMANQEASEFQVTQNPDFYAVKKLIEAIADDKTIVKGPAVKAILDIYFPQK